MQKLHLIAGTDEPLTCPISIEADFTFNLRVEGYSVQPTQIYFDFAFTLVIKYLYSYNHEHGLTVNTRVTTH